jgi:serine O-acetyltransferase
MLLKVHAISRWLYLLKVPILPKIIKGFIYLVFNCVLPPQVDIGIGTRLWHSGLGIIMHPGTRIGKNCNIYNFVVLGGGHDGPGGPPVHIVVGDNVNISTGAKVLCSSPPLIVGNGSTIAANAVVLEDVPENVVVGGIPARVIIRKAEKGSP